jgi:hypothetical protein
MIGCPTCRRSGVPSPAPPALRPEVFPNRLWGPGRHGTAHNKDLTICPVCCIPSTGTSFARPIVPAFDPYATRAGNHRSAAFAGRIRRRAAIGVHRRGSGGGSGVVNG